METIITEINYWNEVISIEYFKRPLEYREASRPCGNGVYIYNSKNNQIYRWSLSLSHDLPYSNSNWNTSKEWHLVKASSIPLPTWWGSNNKLSFGDIGCALPQTLQSQRNNKLELLLKE